MRKGARWLSEPGRATSSGLLLDLVIAAAAIWAVCLTVLTLVTSRITRPMEQLTAGLAELAAGNLDARLQPKGGDEIGKAMAAFNDTAERLRIGTGAAGQRHAPGELANVGSQDGA